MKKTVMLLRKRKRWSSLTKRILVMTSLGNGDPGSGTQWVDTKQSWKVKTIASYFRVSLDKQNCTVFFNMTWHMSINILYPLSSFCAFFSLSMVLISTFTFIISTIDELQYNEQGEVEFPLLLQIINVIDVITVAFFTIEYFVRLACSPRKMKFMKGPMNMIDLCAIIPFYLSLLLEGLEVHFKSKISSVNL